MGATFGFRDIIEVMQRVDTETENREKVDVARDVLTLAVEEGILYVEYNGCVEHPKNNESLIVDDLTYLFSHDVWRSTILELMLEKRKQAIHRRIALMLEVDCVDNKMDYVSRVRLFAHWKGSGEFLKASALALHVGKTFEDIGLNKQQIPLYTDALGMWKSSDNCEKVVGDFSRNGLDALTGDEVTAFIRLYTALGKACTNLHLAKRSIEAYQNALAVSVT
jgi:hypothetical protein